ncbi:MAG: signal peptidase II [Erysipelotrichaceae bacterium]
MKFKEVMVLIIAIVLDMATKMYFQASLALGESIEVIPGFFSFTYAINKGAAWSILEGQMIFFYIVTTIVCIGLLTFLIKYKQATILERYSVVLMLAGALGNFYDRIRFSYVRDFLDFNLFGYPFPIFNLADSFLCIGVALLFLQWFILDTKKGSIDV